VKAISLDTGVLILLLDGKPGSADVETIFCWHRNKKIALYVSNRVFDHDTAKMDALQVKTLRELFEKYRVPVEGAVFRSSFSRLSGKDLLSGGVSLRTQEEMARFVSIVGCDPAVLPPSSVGKRLSNKLGDYDSLRDHYASGRDVFITLDTKDYLSTQRRQRYVQELGLVVLDPSEFVAMNRVFDA
jgi:hypothetical protein